MRIRLRWIVTETEYHSRMGVQRMVFVVRDGGGEDPADAPVDGVGPWTIMPLHEGGAGAVIAAGVASACGLSPVGFSRELVGRPTRRILGWGALRAPGETASSGPLAPGFPLDPLGLILLAESTAAAGAPRFSIPWLLVHPGARRLGVGRELVAVALAEARARGAGTVSIETLDRWPEASAFWERVGFSPVRRRS